MGTNVIYLADHLVPSYRRARTAAHAAPPSPHSAWSEMARRRVAQKRADHAAQGQRELGLVEPTPHTPTLPGTGIAAVATGQCATRLTAQPLNAVAPAPAVRVTHLRDGAQTPGAGRLRISGRLIDVCAELDRLAAAEAQAALPRRA